MVIAIMETVQTQVAVTATVHLTTIPVMEIVVIPEDLTVIVPITAIVVIFNVGIVILQDLQIAETAKCVVLLIAVIVRFVLQ
jgi:hypothetical protein